MKVVLAFVLGAIAGVVALIAVVAWPYYGPIGIHLEPVPPYPAHVPWGDQ